MELKQSQCYYISIEGVGNALATFGRSVSMVLRELSWKSGIAFLDDVLVLGRDFDSHMVNLSNVLGRFEQCGMKLKPIKCQLLQNSLAFLGRLVIREGVQVPPGEITRIGNWGVSFFKRDVQSFIGVRYFHRDHIPKLSLVTKPCILLWDHRLHSDRVQSKIMHL